MIVCEIQDGRYQPYRIYNFEPLNLETCVIPHFLMFSRDKLIVRVRLTFSLITFDIIQYG